MSAMPQNVIGIAFDTAIRPLIDIIDRLRKLGLQQDVKLPNVVVVGDQSSGKSSIIEAISGVELPRGKGIVTRCPLELQLMRIPENEKWKASLSFGNKIITIFNPKEIEKNIREAQNILCGDSKNISAELLTLRIESPFPNAADLTLIDLPGIARIAVQGQSADVCAKIKKIIETYVSNTNTIILCVVASDLDLAVNEALSIATKYDPKKERTIGVLTKPDKTDRHQKEEVIKLLENKRFKLEKGYKVVKCRSQDELEQNVSLEIALKNEKNFFKNDGYFCQVNPSLLGITNLANIITEELKSIIQKTLPSLRKDIEEALRIAQNELDKLPLGVPNDSGEKRLYLSKIMFEMITDVEKLLKEGLFEDKNIFLTWRQYFEEFQTRINNKQSASNATTFTLKNLKSKIANSRGREIGGFLNYETFEKIAAEHVATYELDAKDLLENVRKSTKTNLLLLIDKYLKHIPDVNEDIKIIARDAIENVANQALQHIKFIFEEEQIVFTMDSNYQREIDKPQTTSNGVNQPAQLPVFGSSQTMFGQLASQTVFSAGILKPVNNNVVVNESALKLKQLLEGYLKIVLNRLCDTLPMTIRQWLHIRLCNNLKTDFLKYSTNAEHENKIHENDSLRETRMRLMNKIHRLSQANTELNNFMG